VADWYLGIDFGTTSSTAAVATERGLTALEIEGRRRLPSMVLRDEDGSLLVGTAAENQAAVYPDRVEFTPKRHMGRGAPLLLGGAPVPVTDAVAKLLERFRDEGMRHHGGESPAGVVLTHPVRWEERRTSELREAALAAGLPEPVLLEEPVAAAINYVDRPLDEGAYVAVYDFGGGTFDTAVLRRVGDWFEVVGAPGGDEMIGGEDFDHRVVRALGEAIRGIDEELWERLASSEERKWRRGAADLRLSARQAKEALSSYPTAQVFITLVDHDLRITRREFEAMIGEDVEATVDELEATVVTAGLGIDDLSAVYLVGGSSRIPLVAQKVSERFGELVTTRDDPKAVVALGAARYGSYSARNGDRRPSSGDTVILSTPPPMPTEPVDPVTGQPPAPPDPPVQLPVQTPAPVPVPPAPTSSAEPAPPIPQPVDQVWQQGPVATPVGPQAPSVPVGPYPSGGPDQRAGVRWEANLGQPLSTPTVAGDLVVCGGQDGVIRAFGLLDGGQRWAVQTGGPVTAAPVVADGVAFVGVGDGHVLALDLADGSFRWWYRTGGPVTGAAVHVGGWLFVGSGDRQLYAFNALNGQPIWQCRTGRPVTGGVAHASGSVYAGSGDKSLYAVDLATGLVRWRMRTRGPVSATALEHNGVVFCGSDDGVLRALDPSTGALRWQLVTGGPIRSAPAIEGDRLVLTGGDGILHVVDLTTGGYRWRCSIGAPTWSSPEVRNGTIYLAGAAGAFFALGLDDAAVRWWAPLALWSTSSPAVADGVVVVTGNDGRIQCLAAPVAAARR
jgi:outer membrane protein assembly factor BamB/actin-like ATPase involved in cell morphogenesis